MRDQGLAIEVACRDGALATRLEARDIPVHRFDFSDGLDWKTPYGLAQLSRSFDLVHAHMNRGALYTRLGCWWSGVPWISTAHGMTKAVYYRGARRVIAVSEAVRSHLAAQGIENLTVILNGLPHPCSPSAKDRAAVSAVLERKNPSDCLALVLANLHPNKGQDLLLEAFTKLPERYKLLLAGAGTFQALTSLLDQNPGLADRVFRIGILESGAAPLEAADLVVVPSRREAFSLVAAEARMRGIPVVVSDADGLKEVVPDDALGGKRVSGRDAQVWADALFEVGEHLSTWKKHAEAGQAEALERFSLEPCVQKTRQVYEEILKE